MPRRSEERPPIEILAEIENNVKGLRKVLEDEQGLYEMNMALAMAEKELSKTSSRLSKRISKLLRQEIFKRGNDNDSDTKYDRKATTRIKLDASKIKKNFEYLRLRKEVSKATKENRESMHVWWCVKKEYKLLESVGMLERAEKVRFPIAQYDGSDLSEKGWQDYRNR